MGELNDNSCDAGESSVKIVVTGASGFIGRAVVNQAVARGHQVVAVVRPHTDPGRYAEIARDGVTFVQCNLESDAKELETALHGADAVVHLALVTDANGRHRANESALVTRNVLDAMAKVGTTRLILASSFALYDYTSIPSGSVVDEHSPLITESKRRDAYSHAKLLQESLVHEHAGNHNLDARILRLGVVYGPKHTWTARLGWQLSARLWLRVGSGASVPLSYVEHSAEALLLAAEAPDRAGLVVNVFDDAPPSQAELSIALSHRVSPRPLVVTIPWKVLQTVAALATLVYRRFPQFQKLLPSILNPDVISSRFKPFAYTNHRLRDSLGWKPRFSSQEALDRSFPNARPLDVVGDRSA